MRSSYLVRLACFSFFIAACAASTPHTLMTDMPYPIGTLAPTAFATISTQLGAYPISTLAITTPSQVAKFQLIKPIIEGATQVSGIGPAGVPINLQDVTFMGTLLGQTLISPNGTFVFRVTALEKNHRIGIALGDLTGTGRAPEDFNDPAYQGEGAMQIPQVGFFYDTVLVEAK